MHSFEAAFIQSSYSNSCAELSKMAEVLSKFVKLSIKKGLPASSLQKNREEASIVAQTFLSCCKNPKHPSETEAEVFLNMAGKWLALTPTELLELAGNASVSTISPLNMQEVEKAIDDQRKAIKEEKKRQSRYLEERAKERKIDLQADKRFMAVALAQARKAFQLDEVPIGAVLVNEAGDIVSEAFNCVESTHDPCGHAEILAIRQGAAKIGTHRLNQCTLYVTVEPCAMCTGALINAKIKRLVYGVDEPKTGAIVTNVDLLARIPGAKKISVTKGVLADESSELIKRFFEDKRKNS